MTAEEYFHRTEFDRLMVLCREKYISLSHIGGSVILKAPSTDERNAVGGLLGKVFDDGDIRITLKALDRSLLDSRFNIGLESLLRLYFKDELVTRRDRSAAEKSAAKEFFNDICSANPSGSAADWLKYMLSRKTVFSKRYNEDRDLLRHDIDIVCRALGKLNGRPQLLPVFSAAVSGDPHMLDESSSCGQLFNYAVMYLTETEQINGALERTELLEKVGLYSDMLSSFVYCKNILLYNEGDAHPAYTAFLNRNEAFTLNIGNLTSVTGASALNNRVYIVENPSVFTFLAQETENISLICTAGQPKGACIRLLELLGNTRMYYSGDFDIGGINIAERLLNMFENMLPWHFGTDDYATSLSDKPLPKNAFKSLYRTRHRYLKELARIMAETGFAGYQENILGLLLDDLNNIDKF